MLTEKQLARIVDSTNDTPDTEYLKSPLDVYGPIDFDKLREATRTLGPLRMRSASGPYSVEVMVTDCACGCGEAVVNVLRRNGVFSIRWILDEEDLRHFESLDNFKDNVLAGALLDTSGERQFIERQIEQTFEAHYSDVEPHVCICENCAAHIGEEALWRRMLLSQLASNLTSRDADIEEAHRKFGDLITQVIDSVAMGDMPTRVDRKMARDYMIRVAERFVRGAFDLGYQTGRLFSEYQVKDGIEEHALTGMNFEAKQARRAREAGAKSAEKRLERMRALVSFMEQLATPTTLRFGALALAEKACEDAMADNPALWSQGAGQIEEYVGLIKRGEAGADLKARYLAMFPVPDVRH